MGRQEQTMGQVKEKVQLPRRYQVLIYNDDFTPMDFVVMILIHIFGKSPEAAVQLMYAVHKSTYAVAGVYTRDIAYTKVKEATSMAREQGYPLKLEAVPMEP